MNARREMNDLGKRINEVRHAYFARETEALVDACLSPYPVRGEPSYSWLSSTDVDDGWPSAARIDWQAKCDEVTAQVESEHGPARDRALAPLRAEQARLDRMLWQEQRARDAVEWVRA